LAMLGALYDVSIGSGQQADVRVLNRSTEV